MVGPILIAVGAVIVVGGILLIRTNRRRSAAHDEFVRNGVNVDAVVVRHSRRSLPPPPGSRVSTRPDEVVPVVEFSLPDGQVIQAETLGGNVVGVPQVGSRVRAVHDRRDPTRVVVPMASTRVGSGLITVMGAGLVGFGVLVGLVGVVVLMLSR